MKVYVYILVLEFDVHLYVICLEVAEFRMRILGSIGYTIMPLLVYAYRINVIGSPTVKAYVCEKSGILVPFAYTKNFSST